MPQQAAGLERSLILQLGGHLVVERLDLLPDLAHREDLARRGVGARNLCRLRASLFLRPRHEGRTPAVHEIVGVRGSNYFAAQPLMANGSREALLDGGGE